MDVLGTVLNIIYPFVVIITIISGCRLLIYIIEYIYNITTDDNVYYNDDGTYFEVANIFETMKLLNNALENNKVRISFKTISNKEIFKDIEESEIPKNFEEFLNREVVIIRISKYDDVAINILFNKCAPLNNIYFQYFKIKLKRRSIIE